MDKPKASDLKAAAYASTTLAFAGFGDAFLYAFLPVNGSGVGVPVVWIGILLSVNRFVRIFFNGFMVHFFYRFGWKSMMILAAIFGVLSTAGYAVASTVSVWLFLRVAWGLSFSALRIGTLAYALQSHGSGLALGISRSIQETGPMLALFFAPFLLKNFNPNQIFILLAVLSLPAIYFAWCLPLVPDNKQTPGIGFVFANVSVVNTITFLSSLLIDGVLIVILGVFFLRFGTNITTEMATALAAFYLGYRRLCLVLLSLAGGWISGKVGIETVFCLSLFMVTLGLLVFMLGYIAAGALAVFIFYSINTAITPGVAVQGSENEALNGVSRNVTYKDVGAAFGTLVGAWLITSSHLIPILLIAIFGLMILLLIHIRTSQRKFNRFYLWK